MELTVKQVLNLADKLYWYADELYNERLFTYNEATQLMELGCGYDRFAPELFFLLQQSFREMTEYLSLDSKDERMPWDGEADERRGLKDFYKAIKTYEKLFEQIVADREPYTLDKVYELLKYQNYMQVLDEDLEETTND